MSERKGPYFHQRLPRVLAALLVAVPVALAPLAGAEELEDPTRPGAAAAQPVATPPTEPQWTLSSTLISDQRRVAVINGQRVRAGETVDGAQVIRIEGGSVTIAVDGDQRTLRLGPGIQVRSSSDRGSE